MKKSRRPRINRLAVFAALYWGIALAVILDRVWGVNIIWNL